MNAESEKVTTWYTPKGNRKSGTSPRQLGTSPRQLGISPRQLKKKEIEEFMATIVITERK